MGDWSKYKKFDVVDYLTSEEDFELFIAALREDGASEELIEKACVDIERARIVHNIPAPEAAVAVAV
jgi:DNA-binding phage protein